MVRFDDIAGLICGALFMMIPIVAILARHQQKMAVIMQGTKENTNLASEVERLNYEVRELRSLVNQQTISLDTVRDALMQRGKDPQEIDNTMDQLKRLTG